MGMSLTQDDLQAVKQLIDSSIDERVPRIIDERVPAIIDGRVQLMLDKLEDRTFKRLSRLEDRLIKRINDVDDTLARQTTAGFEEVHDKITDLSVQLNSIEQTTRRIELTQQTRTKHDKLKSINKIA